MDILLWAFGVIVALAIAHFYYIRTISTSLSFFLLLDDRLLDRIDENVRQRLTLHFSGPEPPPPAAGIVDNPPIPQYVPRIEIAALQHVQLVIANTGQRAISFIDIPAISLPPETLLLDATLLYQKPSDLAATLQRAPEDERGTQSMRFGCRLLNRGDFLVAKLLLGSYIDVQELVLHVQAPDVERTIKIKPLPADATKKRWESIEWAGVWIGIMAVAFAASALYIDNGFLNNALFGGLKSATVAEGFEQLRLIHIAVLLSTVGALMLGVVGILLIFGLGIGGLFKKTRIVLPAELRPSSFSSRK